MNKPWLNDSIHPTYQEWLRDQIAMAAMAAIISKIPFQETNCSDAEERVTKTSIGAYEYADAMMKERT